MYVIARPAALLTAKAFTVQQGRLLLLTNLQNIYTDSPGYGERARETVGTVLLCCVRYKTFPPQAHTSPTVNTASQFT